MRGLLMKRGATIAIALVATIAFLMLTLATYKQARAAADHAVRAPIEASMVSVQRGELNAGSLGPKAGRVQLATVDRPPVTYFPERVPDDLSATTLPKAARDVVVARVWVSGRPFWIAGRDQSPGPRPKYTLSAVLRIVDVREGDSTVGERVTVSFRRLGSPDPFTYPHTSNQLNRDYFVVMYPDADDKRCLAAVTITQAQYQEWDNEVRQFERLQGGSGVPR